MSHAGGSDTLSVTRSVTVLDRHFVYRKDLGGVLLESSEVRGTKCLYRLDQITIFT